MTNEKRNRKISVIITSMILVAGTLTLSIPYQEAFAATSVDGCEDDSSSDGERMVMIADINEHAGSGCLVISNNNVTLDCRGHLIDGDSADTHVGISVTGDNVTIKNCTTSDFQHGIELNGSNGSTLRGNTATGNGSSGINVDNGSTNNKIVANESDLNVNGFGCVGASSNTFQRNSAVGNTQHGFAFSDCDNNEFSANIVRSSTNNGFNLVNDSDGNTFKRNTVTDNTDGFSVNSNSVSNTFTANTADGNSDDGFDDNTGADAASVTNTYTRNSCEGNTDSGSEPTGLCSPQA